MEGVEHVLRHRCQQKHMCIVPRRMSCVSAPHLLTLFTGVFEPESSWFVVLLTPEVEL